MYMKPYRPELVFMVLFFSVIMFRKRFAARQQLKKRIATAAAAERDRRRPLGIPARQFTEAELAALQPFAEMFSLEDNLEEWLMEADDAAWVQSNSDSYRY
jgi:hypothetical protein